MSPRMWRLKSDRNESVHDTETDSDRRTDSCSQERGGVGEGLEFGASRCKLAQPGWTGTTVLRPAQGPALNIP